LATLKKHCRGNVRDFQCLLKYFPVSHIWKHWQKYFLPNSETFDEALSLFADAGKTTWAYQNIVKTNNMTNIFAQQCSQFVLGFKGYLYKNS
jgi:hypothetical protein